MIITVKNASQYILFLLTLSGELEYEEVVSNDVIAESYTAKVVGQMIRDKLIRKVTHNTGTEDKVLLRLRDRWSEGAVNDLSKELAKHYDLLVGVPGHRFKSTPTHRERIYRMGVLIKMFYESGVQVDMIRHEYAPNDFGKEEDSPGGGSQPPNAFSSFVRKKTIFGDDGSLLPPQEIFSRLGNEQTCFFTARALSNQSEGQYDNKRNLMNRMYGILVNGRAFYNTYYITSFAEMWWKDVERQAMAVTQRYQSDLYPDHRMGEGAAIIYTPNPAVIEDMFFPPKKTKSRINPPEVYGKSHMLPLSENHSDIRNMLLTHGWEEKLRDMVVEERVPGGDADGMMDGYETFILLDSDMTKMKRLVPRLKGRTSVVVIHPWQERLAQRLYPDAQKIMISADEFENLVDEIQST